jgi:hypothetical protein
MQPVPDSIPQSQISEVTGQPESGQQVFDVLTELLWNAPGAMSDPAIK